MGPEGLEPPPPGLKGRYAAVTPRPRYRSVRSICLSRLFMASLLFTMSSRKLTVAREGVEPSSLP